ARVNSARDGKEQDVDDEKIENSSGETPALPRGRRIEILGPHKPLRRQLIEPGQRHRDRKTNRKRNYDKPNRRVWNFEERKNLRCDLSKEPRDDSIGDSRAVNIAPF